MCTNARPVLLYMYCLPCVKVAEPNQKSDGAVHQSNWHKRKPCFLIAKKKQLGKAAAEMKHFINS